MIVLLTDFGNSEYVGIMKGVIKTIFPKSEIIDLCHTISSQSIIEGSWILKNNFSHFPLGSVFCCVVDPGVGSNRRAICIETKHYTFIGPDNGILWESVKDLDKRVWEIDISQRVSSTFHGRDVFSKAAAIIDSGLHVGNSEILDMIRYEFLDNTVVRIDHFGNIVTNVPHKNLNRYRINISSQPLTLPFCKTYSEAPKNELFFIEGSSSTLEISMKNGNAASTLSVNVGDKIQWS